MMQSFRRSGPQRPAVTIVSGGQTGVDRAALDVAIELGLIYRGWCPRDGWAEDMPVPPGVLARYANLRETPTPDPRQRTEWNVRDSDRLLVLADGTGLAASKGTAVAVECARRLGNPYMIVNLDVGEARAQAAAFLREPHRQLALNIAGPRESEAPGIYTKARTFLLAVFRCRRISD
jgi:hypothetical protein